MLAWVPLRHILGVLNIEQLYAVGLLTGALSTLSGAAYAPFLLAIVHRDRILEANRRLSPSDSAASVSGPGAAGLLAQAITAPSAVAIDAASFFVSAAPIALVRTRKTRSRDGLALHSIESSRRHYWRIADVRVPRDGGGQQDENSRTDHHGWGGIDRLQADPHQRGARGRRGGREEIP